MIIDTLQNADRYRNLHPLFSQAFDHILAEDPAELKPGSTELDGENLRAIMIEQQSISTEESLKSFECHNKYIDIQVSYSGGETFGWKPRNSCNQPQAPYDESRDVAFFNDAPDTFFTLQVGQFAIFYPEDVHAPMINNEGITLRKLVMKVKV